MATDAAEDGLRLLRAHHPSPCPAMHFLGGTRVPSGKEDFKQYIELNL